MIKPKSKFLFDSYQFDEVEFGVILGIVKGWHL